MHTHTHHAATREPGLLLPRAMVMGRTELLVQSTGFEVLLMVIITRTSKSLSVQRQLSMLSASEHKVPRWAPHQRTHRLNSPTPHRDVITSLCIYGMGGGGVDWADPCHRPTCTSFSGHSQAAPTRPSPSSALFFFIWCNAPTLPFINPCLLAPVSLR